MIDFDALVLGPNQNTFGKPIIVSPLVSQPGALPYAARGIWTVRHVEAITDSGDILTTRQLTIDIRLSEFSVPPQQNDQVSIVVDVQSEFPGVTLGSSMAFLIDDLQLDSGGACKLLLKRIL